MRNVCPELTLGESQCTDSQTGISMAVIPRRQVQNRIHDCDCKRIADDAMPASKRYPRPGNVRELQNAIQRLAVMTDGELISLKDLPGEIATYCPSIGGCAVTIPQIIQFDFSGNRVISNDAGGFKRSYYYFFCARTHLHHGTRIVSLWLRCFTCVTLTSSGCFRIIDPVLPTKHLFGHDLSTMMSYANSP